MVCFEIWCSIFHELRQTMWSHLTHTLHEWLLDLLSRRGMATELAKSKLLNFSQCTDWSMKGQEVLAMHHTVIWWCSLLRSFPQFPRPSRLFFPFSCRYNSGFFLWRPKWNLQPPISIYMCNGQSQVVQHSTKALQAIISPSNRQATVHILHSLGKWHYYYLLPHYHNKLI